MIAGLLDKPSDAIISGCSRYRYWLHRQWEDGEGFLIFVMLNPSTADGIADDPTIRRCIGFAKAGHYRGIIVVNLCGYRSSTPITLLRVRDPEGPHNRAWILRALEIAQDQGRMVAAWGGNAVAIGPRTRTTRLLLRSLAKPIYCLGTTQDGHPRHPLYVPNVTELQRYNWE